MGHTWEGQATQADRDTIRVLLVDDDPSVGELTADFLGRGDDRIEAVTATCAGDGLDELAGGRFDCIISDYDMPGRNGIEFLETVREDYPDLPFILYTGKGSEEVASEAISAGVTDYIQKDTGPSQYEIMRNRVENAVNQRRARTAAAETEQRLRTLAENTDDILWMFTADWNELLFINSAYEDVSGRSISELEANPESLLEGVHPDDRALVRESMARLSRGESVDIEYRVDTKEDTDRWIWAQGEPVRADDGEVEKLVGFARDITHRKEREGELERLKDRFQAFTENSLDVISVVDEDGIIQYESPSVEQVLGYAPAELVGENVYDYVHPDDREAVRDTFAGASDAPESETHRAEYRMRHRDGEWIWVESIGSNHRHAVVEGYVITSRDVTDRKEREQDLKRTQADLRRYERAIEGSTDLLAAVDTEYNLLFANEQYRDYHGLSPDEIEQVTLPEVLGPAWESEIKQRVDRSLTGEVIHYEMQREGPEGVVQNLDIRYYPLWAEDGSIDGSVAAMRDVTTRKEREESLERLHAATREGIEASTIEEVVSIASTTATEILNLPINGIHLFDPDEEALVPVEWSDELEGVFDGPPPTIPSGEGLAWQAYSTGEPQIFGSVHELDETLNQDTPFRSELHLPLGKHGVLLAASRTPHDFDAADEVLAHVFAANLEAALDRVEREQELKRQNERLDEFASIVSHDLRNPLNIAAGRAQLAKADCQSEHLDVAIAALDRSQELIDDLFVLARDGGRAADLEAVDLAALSRKSWEHVQTADATLTTDVDRTIRADPSRLQQLLANLYRNAVEHGRRDVAVRIGEIADGFYMEDDGPGIPPDERDEVFTAGYTTAESGTGYGLSIVQQVTDAHGWDVRVTDGTNGGARFEITGVERI